jgi:zinc transport system ATP-binding protein
MNAPTPLIDVRKVTVGYGREVVLDQADLQIRQGDYLAVIGPNGGGKTTLLKVILGLLKPWSGEVVLNLPRGRGRIGYVPQFFTFDREFPLRVLDVVLMGRLGARGMLRAYSAADTDAARRALAGLRLERLEQAHITELSGGQLQRVLIARALASDPAVLLLDEPTASVDAESREILRATLEEMSRRIPIVLVTHDVTAVSTQVRQYACVNRQVYYHDSRELSTELLERVYGCPVELIAHGLPHRVLVDHTGHAHG